MLKLLLDEHISRHVSTGLRRRNRLIEIFCMSEWEEGTLGQDDSVCLHAAALRGLTVVTYDRRTIPPLLKDWAEQERDHGGVIFVDERTIAPSDRRFGYGAESVGERNGKSGLDESSFLSPPLISTK
jgi:hypothetical protein